MVPFLLACLRSNLSGGGGGGAFTITGVNITINQPGTSYANPLKFNVSLAYTGSVSGITVTLEKRWDRGEWETVDTNLFPTDFPYVEAMAGYYNKFGTAVPVQFRITDDTDSTNTVTSSAYTTTYTLPV